MKTSTPTPALALLLVLLALVGVEADRVHAASFSEQDHESSVSNSVRSESSPRQPTHRARPRRISPRAKLALDRSGHPRFGKASFYARMFGGRTMADGTPMLPTGNNAASLTLPLGTTAKVTNLQTGKTAIVTIRDRGPYVEGRIVDLSPATARKIGLDARTGVTDVEVAPIAVPMPGGAIKLGDEALQASNRPLEASLP